MPGTERFIRPYLLDVEYAKLMGMQPTSRSIPGFGDQLLTALSWRAGGKRNMNTRPIKVPVLGTQDDSFFCPPDLFYRAACTLGADPIFEPPPFACPCTDGILVIYTLKRLCRDGSVDIRGGYFLLTQDELEKELHDAPICAFWKKASKPTSTAVMLNKLGFGETRWNFLN